MWFTRKAPRNFTGALVSGGINEKVINHIVNLLDLFIIWLGEVVRATMDM